MQIVVARLLKQGVLLALLVAFGVYVWSIRQELVLGLYNMTRGTAVMLAGLLVSQWALRAWRDKYLYSAAGYSLRVTTVFWLNNVQLALNYLPFKAGTFSAVSVLRSRFGVKLDDLAFVVLQQYLLTLCVSSALASIAIWFSSRSFGTTTVAVSLVLGAAGTITFGIMNGSNLPTFLPGFVSNKLRVLGSNRVAVLRGGHPRTLPLLLLTTGICGLSAVRMVMLFGLLHSSVSLPDALVISAALLASPLVAITPAGLGVTESVVGVFSFLVAQSLQSGVVVATLDRAVILVVACISGVIVTPAALRSPRRS